MHIIFQFPQSVEYDKVIEVPINGRIERSKNEPRIKPNYCSATVSGQKRDEKEGRKKYFFFQKKKNEQKF